MAAAQVLEKEVEDITECPICKDTFCNPKVLPCLHVFCLKCITQYGKERIDGDTMPCPMCRQEFTVPTGGFTKLSTNFFIDRLIVARSILNIADVDPCDSCLVRGQRRVAASSFCMECRKHICDPCSRKHESMQETANHNLTHLGEPWVEESPRNELRKNLCESHSKVLVFYCKDCKMSICVRCFNTAHDKHKICEIEEIAGKFKDDLKRYSIETGEFIQNIDELTRTVSKQSISHTQAVGLLEKEIVRRGEDIKRMVDKQTNDLLEELKLHKTCLLSSIQKTQEDLQRNRTILDNFKQVCMKVFNGSDSVDIVRVADSLKTRAGELKGLCIPELGELPQFEFIPNDYDTTKINQVNMVGKLSRKMPLPGLVGGITSSNKELFVVLQKSHVIEVYDIDTLAHQRKITVKGLAWAYDMVAHANVLHVSEREDRLIHRIQLPVETYTNWFVNSRYLTLSTTKEGNVVVSCCELDKIIEYTSDGTCVRSLMIGGNYRDVVGLRHAMQLNGDQFLICCSTPQQHRVCLIDSSGGLTKTHGGKPGFEISQLNLPNYLTIDAGNHILVADWNNNRVIHLNSELAVIKEFNSETFGLRIPTRMHFNEKTRSLYVAELNEKRVIIFEP